MINTKFTISGIEFNDYTALNLTNAVSNNLTSSYFVAMFDTPYGRHKDDFVVGKEINLYADSGTTPTTKLFTGILEEVMFNGEGLEQKAELSGRDYSARLQDSTVAPIVYTNSEISTIVKNIIDNNVNDITYTNTGSTSTTLSRIAFNQISCYDAISQLADLAGYTFWVDVNKDLHFSPVGSISAGVTFDNSNIDFLKFDTTRQGMANKIYVYGDRYLDNYKETFTAGSPLGGSIFTLYYKPSNTEVTVSGGVIQPGAIEGISFTVGSDVKYLVNYNDKKIIFTSGTTQGLNIPTSGNSVVIQYKRQLPIVKYGQNNASISLYGPKTKIINDKSIKDPATALTILKQQLEDTDPFKEIRLESQGWYNITPGQTVIVNIPNFSIENETMPVIETSYKFTPQTINSSKIQSFRLNRKIFDITDEITALRRRLDLIDAQDRQNTDLITRLEQITGSLTVVGSYWEVKTRTGLGSSFILGVAGQGTNPQAGGRLGSIIGSGINFLGDSRNQLILLTSGGYSY